MPKKTKEQKIQELLEEIALLTKQVEKLQKKKDSLWNTIYEANLEEENSEETSEYWAERLSGILRDWATRQRDKLAKEVMERGVMPPYSQCLNDLIISSTNPNLDPVLLEDVPVELPKEIDPILPTPPSLGEVPSFVDNISEDARIGPPRMKRVNVPKPIPGAVPVGLPSGGSSEPR